MGIFVRPLDAIQGSLVSGRPRPMGGVFKFHNIIDIIADSLIPIHSCSQWILFVQMLGVDVGVIHQLQRLSVLSTMFKN